MTFLDRLNSQEFDFTKNLSGSKIIKFGQSQALTSHFESFWSIVHLYFSTTEEKKYLTMYANFATSHLLQKVP